MIPIGCKDLFLREDAVDQLVAHGRTHVTCHEVGPIVKGLQGQLGTLNIDQSGHLAKIVRVDSMFSKISQTSLYPVLSQSQLGASKSVGVDDVGAYLNVGSMNLTALVRKADIPFLSTIALL